MLPLKRPAGKKHFIRIFPTLQASIAAYMLNLNRKQIMIFIFVVVLVLTTTCKEYYVNCNDIRGTPPSECRIMTQAQCQTWANDMFRLLINIKK